ncbi:hypothetical protein PYW07_003750 [Mythimna separata]|uniref:Uncharacterized protein n=1 Tax=Mythimna separata TaxID=271217 RepID=A0AAD7YNY0_MYTSE|nr:hypothetical protein PYW07_003750 [Mythimna separata]
MAKFLLLVVLSAILAVAFTKHIHPRNMVPTDEDAVNDSEPIRTDIDGMPIEVIRNIKPNRFIPVNNVLFFMSYPPCEEGFERDLVGVCREVWD